ncbi:hypothetical protein K1T71_002321 [Dendrolimus kikuchii]|uniref:Uncharacterized protein n=1 Tax=Dendrolimus kikuchii TaxID=765133 RepID=A0ACC1DCY4_9NEOP|nr:hypothetical protein K1T71_002321 [Dendrolimus kikuchii]
MGVRGLTTYIHVNQDCFLQKFCLHDTCLVIDGHSLCAQLYRSLNCFSAFGGDYDRYASYTRNFFKSLRKCHITAYVIFDGSYEPRKLKTAYSRLRSKINGASRLDPVTQDSIQIFPLQLRDVFKEVLVEMNVAFTVCEYEADDEIAAMARHLNCPVLSYDSDFYIYNVLYIPYNTLEFKPKLITQDGEKVFALECKIYKVEHMTKCFGGLKEEVLPLLATLLGNDYVEKRVFRKFFSQFKLPKRKNRNDQQRCIHGLFLWLQNETLETAIPKIVGRLKKSEKDKILALIKKSINGYNRKYCRSLKYFSIKVDETPETEVLLPVCELEGSENEDTTDSSSDDEKSSENDEEITSEARKCEYQVDVNLPQWFVEGVRENKIPQSYIDLYTLHLYFCSPQADDYNEDDSFLCNLPILRYAFDILNDFSEEKCTYVSREKHNLYKRIIVDRTFAISRPLEVSFEDLTDEQMKSYFSHFFNEKLPLLDLDVIKLLPDNFQLYMIAIIWWVANCKVTLSSVHSLFICYIMLDVIDEKTGMIRGYNHFNNKFSKKIEVWRKNPSYMLPENTEYFFNKNKVQYEDCLIAANELLKLFDLDDKILKKPSTYDPKRMHSFAQFQCCIQQINCLNILCGNPFQSTKLSKCFNGTFIYNMSTKLENQNDPNEFMQGYFKGAKTILLFYHSLCKIYEKCVREMDLEMAKFIRKKTRRGRKNKNSNIDEEINFVVKGFESEVII